MQQASTTQSPEKQARSYVVLSIGAAIVNIAFKLAAYSLTNSVGMFSDAIESFINLLAAVVAFWMLTVAARPPDEEHAYGHFKAEYFSSGVESALIMLAAVGIGATAWGRLFNPQPLENVGLGLGLSLVASAVNGGVGFVLLRAGRRLRSITLRADAHHLFADVWTSIGVLLGVVLVKATGWLVLDPLIAFAVAANIVWTGFRLLNDTAHGLLDTALSSEDQGLIERVLSRYREQGIQFHALRTRVSGQHRFVSLHVLMPGDWTVQRGHNLCERIEADIIAELPRTTVFTHAEPVEDPVSHEDQELERPARQETGARAS
jgi:cation diffusion facilitator family transporter